QHRFVRPPDHRTHGRTFDPTARRHRRQPLAANPRSAAPDRRRAGATPHTLERDGKKLCAGCNAGGVVRRTGGKVHRQSRRGRRGRPGAHLPRVESAIKPISKTAKGASTMIQNKQYRIKKTELAEAGSLLALIEKYAGGHTLRW